MDLLGRFYTNTFISELLISTFENQAPRKVIDLGVGDASLSIVAFKQWNSANFYATEIEPHKVQHINDNLSFLKVYNYDTLHPKLSTKLKIKLGSIDIAICNPPYTRVDDKKQYEQLFIEVDCGEFNKLKRITSEIVFFAHNLKLLKRNGELGIIVSDTLIAGKEFEIFRKTILKQFDVKKVIQLPDNIFKKTEARTHIIFLGKNKPTNETVEIYQSDISGVLSEKITVSKALLIDRMDFQYHSRIGQTCKSLKKLSDLGVIIKRGRFTDKYLRTSGLPYMHTKDLPLIPKHFSFNRSIPDHLADWAAHKGDILMGRVGKGCVGRLSTIKKGSVILSDCVYRITVSLEHREAVWASLLSQEGQNWLKANIHGVCSKVISKCDLENFPIFMSDK